MNKIILVLCLFLVGCNTNENSEITVDNTENMVLVEDLENVPEELDEVAIEEAADETVEEIVDVLYPHYEILFSSERGGDRDLYLTSPYQETPRLLLDLPSIEGHGDFAPDGYRIVFFSDMDGDRDLYMIDLRDEVLSPIQLTNAPGQDHLPDWSPCGKYIVFTTTRFGQADVMIMNADGSEQTRITDSAAKELAPTFSPDGKRVSFTTFIDGKQFLGSVKSEFLLQEISIDHQVSMGYVDYNKDGKSLVCHKDYDLYEVTLEDNDIKKIVDSDSKTLWVPVYSPDGQWIAYNSEGGFGSGEIFIRELKTGLSKRITFDPDSDWGPDWRPIPFSEKILYDSDLDGDREIYLKYLETNETIQLTDNKYKDGLACWSPDGSKIAFFSNRDGDDEIYMMNADGTDVTQLTHNTWADRTPSWSLDGHKIAYASAPEGQYDIFLMDLKDNSQEQLTFSSQKEFWTTYGPKGDYIYYTHFDSRQDTYRVDIKSKEVEKVWENCSRVAFSPKGDQIAYSRYENGHWNIYIRDLKTDQVLQLSDSMSNEWVPTWSPDGEKIIYSREKGYKSMIIQVNIETLESETIEPLNAQNWRPIYLNMGLDE